MFHTALSALTAFYRTTVVILPLGHHRTLHLHTLPALLLIPVDGRWAGKAEGMTADELTRFIIKYFNPRYALNMDGGGSTTMCVRGRGDSRTHVVNYPTDNRKYNHYGQRPREAHLIIDKVR